MFVSYDEKTEGDNDESGKQYSPRTESTQKKAVGVAADEDADTGRCEHCY